MYLCKFLSYSQWNMYFLRSETNLSNNDPMYTLEHIIWNKRPSPVHYFRILFKTHIRKHKKNSETYYFNIMTVNILVGIGKVELTSEMLWDMQWCLFFMMLIQRRRNLCIMLVSFQVINMWSKKTTTTKKLNPCFTKRS